MKASFLWDQDHALMYLADTIINIDGVPSKVLDVRYSAEEDDSLRLVYIPLHNQEITKYIDLDDPRVSFDSPELGYVNQHRGKKIYRALRFPKRQWKIGIHPINTSLYNMEDDFVNDRVNLYTLDMANTITGKYPDFLKAMEKLGDKKAVAFSRRFAVNENQEIFHFFSNKPVGHFKDNEIPILEDEFEYLRQTLDEDMAHEG